MGSSCQGMKTYEAIISSVREKGLPIGPKHFLHDAQLKEWAKRHPEQAMLLQQTRTPKAIRAKKSKKEQVVEPVKQLTLAELVAAKERMKAKLGKVNTSTLDQAILQAKFVQEKANKLAATITPLPLMYKSVGNGL